MNIGLTQWENNSNKKYVDWLRGSGLNRIFNLPLSSSISTLSNIDLLILPGGADVNTLTFKQENISSFNCSLKRDEWELGFIRYAMERRIPIIGICRGFQLLIWLLIESYGLKNIKMLNNVSNHDQQNLQVKRNEPFHFTYEKLGGIFTPLMEQGRMPVNSLHHQGVEYNPFYRCELGGFAVTTTSNHPKGELVESFEANIDNTPIIGAQWHPEEMDNGQEQLRLIIEKIVKERSRAYTLSTKDLKRK